MRICTQYTQLAIKKLKSNFLPRKNVTYGSDFFIKNPSFLGYKNITDEKSYESFINWSNQTNFLSQVREIDERTGEILGYGFEGTTFGIPGTDNWVLKKYNRGNFVAIGNNEAKIIEIKDFSPKLNVGQTISRIEIPAGNKYSYIYYILKRQSGKSIGVPLYAAEDISDINIKSHLEALRTLAAAPQETFDKCIKDIEYITQQGYEFDCGNPYNFMFDRKKQAINFVDINDKLKDNNTQYGDVLYALLDGKFAINFNASDCDIETKETAKTLSYTIINKYVTAMKKANAKFSEGKFFTELLETDMLNNLLKSPSKEKKMTRLREMGLMQ